MLGFNCNVDKMKNGKQILVCQSGGEILTADDGSLLYKGGDAHAIGVDSEMSFDELKSEIADMWQYDACFIVIKYFLPDNKKQLITISSDKDVQRMLDFYEGCSTVDVFVFTGDDIVDVEMDMPADRY